jgi:hypothetical protein
MYINDFYNPTNLRVGDTIESKYQVIQKINENISVSEPQIGGIIAWKSGAKLRT